MLRRSPAKMVRGFSSFFRPSDGVAIRLLIASVERARHSDLPNSRKIANTIACLSKAAFKDHRVLDRVREDVSKHLWRYLGTLSRRGAAMRSEYPDGRFEVDGPEGCTRCDLLVKSEELASGMQQRLGLDEEHKHISDHLINEFTGWLRYDFSGYYPAPWATIVAIEDGIGLRAEVLEQDRKTEREPVEVIANYNGISEEELISLLAEANDEG